MCPSQYLIAVGSCALRGGRPTCGPPEGGDQWFAAVNNPPRCLVISHVAMVPSARILRPQPMHAGKTFSRSALLLSAPCSIHTQRFAVMMWLLRYWLHNLNSDGGLLLHVVAASAQCRSMAHAVGFRDRHSCFSPRPTASHACFFSISILAFPRVGNGGAQIWIVQSLRGKSSVLSKSTNMYFSILK